MHFQQLSSKNGLSVLLPVITQMINVSLSSGQFPRSFSHALVKPLLKKPNADCEILKNYRPVSNLTFLSKILEKVVARRLFTYMSEDGLHEKMQSAYRTAHSTESALIRVQNDILRQLDKTTWPVGQKNAPLINLTVLTQATVNSS